MLRKLLTVKEIPTLAWSSTTPLNLQPKPTTLGYLILGLILFGIGESLLITSGAGVSPWTVLAQGMAGKLGWTIGFATLVVSLAVLLLWLPLSQKPGLGTLLNAIIIAIIIDVAQPLLPEPQQLGWQIAQATLGVVIVGVSSSLYLTANLGPGPRDGLMTGLQAMTRLPIAQIRIGIEISVVAVGWYLGGAVGVGTLLFAFGVGPCVALGILLLRRFL